jgi:nitroreductase
MGIISPPGDDVPSMGAEQASACLLCGQCEAFCPSGSLTLDHPDRYEKQKAWKGQEITPALMGSYMKTRRSIRHFKPDPVSRETITSLLDIARYAPSGGNGQPVEWLVIHDPEKVQQVAGLTIAWMKTLVGSSHPMGSYVPSLIAGWDAGYDVICRGAPHLMITHVPDGESSAPVDGIIALAHADIAAPSFGVGTCWAGFVAMASKFYPPLKEMYGLPQGRVVSYAMMLGYPRYKPSYIPDRKPLAVSWM